jgi:hypothetical protein
LNFSRFTDSRTHSAVANIEEFEVEDDEPEKSEIFLSRMEENYPTKTSTK